MSATDPVSCDFCGVPIAPEKFAQGKAVVILRKKYCPKCIQTAVLKGRMPAPPPTLPPPPVPPPAPKRTRRLTVGEHGCGLYASEEERRAQMLPFVREGLLNGQRLLYF